MPRKNIRPLAGRPLLAHALTAITAARRALPAVNSRLVVSTEDEEIAAVAREWGAEVPALRPAEFAQDHSPEMEAVGHMLEVLLARENYTPTALVFVQPTSPLIAPADITGATDLFLRTGASVASVVENEHPLEWTYHLKDGRLEPVIGGPTPKRRQDARPTYRLNGAVSVASLQQIRTKHSFLVPETVAYIMPPERSIDIDTMVDFAVAEALLNSHVPAV